MVAGGKRDRAGRKPSDPTKQVRIPIDGADAARGLVDAVLNAARKEMLDRHPNVRLDVRLVGVEHRQMQRKVDTYLADYYDGPVVIAEATDGEITERFVLSLCGRFCEEI